MKPAKSPADDLRARYLLLCEDLIEHTQAMRGHAMKPGNTWLARSELTKINALISELELLLDQLKAADKS